MTKNVTLKELRPNLPKIIDDVNTKMDRFVITKRGKPTAILMSIEDYESLLETLDILSDKELTKNLKTAIKDIKTGNLCTLEEIEKVLEAE
jgi:antitoxin YefM